MTQLIGISGKKSSGKSSVTKHLITNADSIFGDGSAAYVCVNDPDGRGARYKFRSGSELRVRAYAFADALKKFCVDVLGLAERQVYGSEDQKNELTRFRWEDLPHYAVILAGIRRQVEEEVASERKRARFWDRWGGDLLGAWKNMVENRVALRAPLGQMTGREVLQVFGTDICRKMWADVWVQACLRQIRKERPDVALIDDVRFPGEVLGIEDEGGVTIRLERAANPDDVHPSETALDDHPFAFRVPSDATLEETIEQVVEIVVAWLQRGDAVTPSRDGSECQTAA